METTKAASTGGILNVINERYKCNSKNNSVPVMQLIRYHSPKTNDHLVNLIASHTVNGKHNNCQCGCKSQGTIEDFGMNLYNANLKYFNSIGKPNEAKSLEECELFMYTLFVTYSLKGNNMEAKALNDLKKMLPSDFTIEFGSEKYDFKYGVDLVITKDNMELCGVQVKPISYKNIPDSHDVKKANMKKNMLYGKPVYYIYYDIDLEFINTNDIYNLIIATN